MRKIYFTFFLVIVLIFSSCSTFNSSKTGKNEVVTSGYGLEVDFKIDDRYIKQRKLIYEINLKNTGLKPVKLSEQNIELYTVQSVGQSGYFSQESVNSFKDNVLGNLGNLELYNSQKRDASGSLLFSDQFDFKNFEKLDYILDINYDYETEFDNNLEFKNKYSMFELNKLDRVSQAAPLQISDIKLIPGILQNEYLLEYHFEDRGRNGYFANDKTQIDINELTIMFGNQDITSNCRGLIKEVDKRDIELSLNELKISKDTNLIVECKITLEGIDTFTTKSSGNFKYTYKIQKRGTISIPKLGN